MSPALFLFEVLKMVKLTRGPLVLYQIPKYWSRKPVVKNNFKFWKKPHAYLQTILKAPVKFQRIGLKLWEELRGQGTYSLYASVVLELKKCLS